MERILDYIKEKGEATRSEICEHFNMKRTTAYDHLFRLKAKGLIKKYRIIKKDSKGMNQKGRPKIVWTIIRNREWIGALQAYPNITFKMAMEIADKWETMFDFIEGFMVALKFAIFEDTFFYKSLLKVFRKEESELMEFISSFSGLEKNFFKKKAMDNG
ncbi:MAG: winged helix-turn-helix transcriptional regulator [Candidatus Helarchaeota archaeon]